MYERQWDFESDHRLGSNKLSKLQSLVNQHKTYNLLYYKQKLASQYIRIKKLANLFNAFYYDSADVSIKP